MVRKGGTTKLTEGNEVKKKEKKSGKEERQSGGEQGKPQKNGGRRLKEKREGEGLKILSGQGGSEGREKEEK